MKNIEKYQSLLASGEVDALLLTSEYNRLYAAQYGVAEGVAVVTKEGAYYIRTVEKILFLERNLERYFQDIAGLQGGTLALGGASYFCSFVYPDLIARFQTKYPQVTIDLTEGNTRELKAGLENESLDLVLETAMEKDDTSIKRY